MPPAPKRLDVNVEELESILDRAKTSPLGEEDLRKIHAALETLLFLTQELGKKHASIHRLKKLLFGLVTETTRKVTESARGKTEAEPPTPPEKNEEPKKGHGRHGADAYRGAAKVAAPHGSLKPGDACPACGRGTVYAYAEPGWIVRLRGRAPVDATVYELERLRCHLCGELFTAAPPAGVGEAKYDASSASMIALLKYGSGLPFHRLETLQAGLGIPLPASTQWEVVAHAGRSASPVFDLLIHQAAQGEVLYNDDTAMKVLGLMRDAKDSGEIESQDEARRTGIFTSAVVSESGGRKIALFFTGRRHAGENLTEVLKRRAERLGPPIQMCDALSRNVPKELSTILANCMAHGRRQFVDVVDAFPDECLHVLEILREVYRTDARAREENMTPEARLALHQSESGPRMEGLKTWCTDQIESHAVEPNSGLGEAIRYMLAHWEALTLFLRVPGAPLDNNLCERTLKKAILHRKNAYFYKTENGAHVGDLYMSLIHTCELSGANPFEYLTALQDHAREVAARPDDWLPWNYTAALTQGRTPPANA